MENANDEFHDRVGSAFRQFVDPRWQHSHPECGPIKLIDGTGDEKTVHQRIITTLIATFPQPFGSLKS
jgi:thymidylate kinase